MCQAAPGSPSLASAVDRNWTQECTDGNLNKDRRQDNKQGPLQKLAMDEECRVSASVKGWEQLSHILIRCTVEFFILPLVRLYAFSISVYVITLIRIGYRHKSHAVHTPHIPL